MELEEKQKDMDIPTRLQTLDWERYTKCARQAAADGIVLLRNEKAVLPLPEGETVALFGVSQLCYYKSGTGSGGMVNVSHVVSIREALEDEPSIRLNRSVLHLYDRYVDEHPFAAGEGWGKDPWSQAEMPLDRETAEQAGQDSRTAIVVIGRTAGEDRDNKAEPGSFLLTETELDMLRTVRGAFARMVVLLNTGNIIDMRFVDDIRPDAVLYVWQGGMVGGLGVVDVLTGRVSPSGHLTDTIAERIEDYPSSGNFGTGVRDVYQEDIYVGYRFFETVARDRVLYPFGYGLSYTTFRIRARKKQSEPLARLSVDLEAEVTNTGHAAGREVVQVYAQAPQGVLGKPARVLVGFEKTRLLKPGESQTLQIQIPVRSFASFDESGKTAEISAWVLEEGRYDLYVGENVRDAVILDSEDGAFTLSEDWMVLQEEEALAPVCKFDRMAMSEENGDVHLLYEETPLRSIDVEKRIYENLPGEAAQTGDRGLKLSDVEEGSCRMEDFIAQLSDEDLCAVIRGEGMGSPLVTPGTAAAFGGVTKRLRDFGIPAVCCDDGPSGMRLDCGDHAFSLPNGTMLACTFDRELNEQLFSFLGLEMVKNRVDCILGPGVNIHRNPLNGRNFEYFSEDPYLSGEMAAAQLRGLHQSGVTGVLKHFCANNRETRRHELDSVVSGRALREIYLRPFEIAVTEGGADALMTTYGKVNGIHTASLYDLTTTILRNEWGFDGIVMTDWWAAMSEDPSELAPSEASEPGTGEAEGEDVRRLKRSIEGKTYDFSPMVRAQNDLYMVVPDGEKTAPSEDGEAGEPTTLSALQGGRLTRAELQRCAMNICRFAMKTEAMKRLLGHPTEVTVENVPEGEDLSAVESVTFQPVPQEGLELDLSSVHPQRGEDYLFGLQVTPNTHYRIELKAESVSGVLAQIPVSLFFTTIPVAEWMFGGGEGKEAVKTAIFFSTTRNSVMRLHFGQSGLVLKSLRVQRTGD